jgi:hypothetical protein
VNNCDHACEVPSRSSIYKNVTNSRLGKFTAHQAQVLTSVDQTVKQCMEERNLFPTVIVGR